MGSIIRFLQENLRWFSLPKMGIIDIFEILIIAYAIYKVICWVKNTRAWMLVKGIIMLLAICLIAILLEMKVILWIFQNAIGVGITAIVIVFQPELRNALEQLGRQNVFRSIFLFDEQKEKNEKFSEQSINEIVRAVFELAKEKTGALIVLEQEILLKEYERTGILIDSAISSQLLINIFSHNTPLHDGAVILRDNRIVTATCYLPLSDNLRLSKDLGTRHRAGIGISEVADCLTIIVSEESGKVSIALEGILYQDVNAETLKRKILNKQKRIGEGKKITIWKGRHRHEKKDHK